MRSMLFIATIVVVAMVLVPEFRASVFGVAASTISSRTSGQKFAAEVASKPPPFLSTDFPEAQKLLNADAAAGASGAGGTASALSEVATPIARLRSALVVELEAYYNRPISRHQDASYTINHETPEIEPIIDRPDMALTRARELRREIQGLLR